jgi:ADP-ribose pyrophosphatase
MNSIETLFETRWLGLYRIGHWDFVRRPQAEACVGILAITPAAEVVLIEQFRVPVQCPVIEIPAGLVGDEDEFRGESLAETARRELLEETGYRAAEIRPLLTSPTSAGMTSEFTHLFLATGGGGPPCHHPAARRQFHWRSQERYPSFSLTPCNSQSLCRLARHDLLRMLI